MSIVLTRVSHDGRDDISFSLLYQIKLGTYESDISYAKLTQALGLLKRRRKVSSPCRCK
jgi:hypothetical protein